MCCVGINNEGDLGVKEFFIWFVEVNLIIWEVLFIKIMDILYEYGIIIYVMRY